MNCNPSASQNKEALLYINYDPLPAEEGKEQTYNLTFIFKNGAQSFEKNSLGPFKASNANIYFAFSADYTQGKALMYAEPMDGVSEGIAEAGNMNYPNFSLKNGAEIVLGDVSNNSVFTTLGGYQGKIGIIEMSDYYND